MATFVKVHQDGFHSIHHWISQVLPMLSEGTFERIPSESGFANFTNETMFQEVASVSFIWTIAAKILPSRESSSEGSDAPDVACSWMPKTGGTCVDSGAVNLLSERIGNILGPLVDNLELRNKITYRIRSKVEHLSVVHCCIFGGGEPPAAPEMRYFECGDVALTIWGWILSIWLNSQAASDSFLSRFRAICRSDCFEKLSHIIQESGALLFESVEAAESVKQRLSVCRLSLPSPPGSIVASPSRSDCSEDDLPSREVFFSRSQESEAQKPPIGGPVLNDSVLDLSGQRDSELSCASGATQISRADYSQRSTSTTLAAQVNAGREDLAELPIHTLRSCNNKLSSLQSPNERPGVPISAVQLNYLILENKEFYGESQRLTKALKESEGELAKLQIVVQEKDDEIAHLKSRVNSKSDAESDAVNELLELRRKLNEQTVKVTRLTKHNEWLTSLISQEAEKSDLSRSVGPSGPDLGKHFGPSTTSDRARKEIALLREDCIRIRSQLMEQTTENESLAERLSAAVKEIKSLKAENNKFREADVERECLASEVERLKTTVESQLSTNRILQNELLQLQSEPSSKGGDWYDENSFVQMIHGSTEIPLHQEILRLSAEKKQLQRQLETANSIDIETMKKDAKLLEDKLTKFAEELVVTKKQLALKEEELAQFKFREERLEQSIHLIRAAAEQERKANKNLIDRLNDEADQLKQQHEQLSKSLQSAMEEHTDTLDRLQKSVEANNELSIKMRELQEELVQEQLVRHAIEEELKRAVNKCEVERIAAKAREAEARCHELQGEIELQKISIEDLKCTINDQSNRLQENQERLKQSVESVTQETKARKQFSGRVIELQSQYDMVIQQRAQLDSKVKLLQSALAHRDKELDDTRLELGSLKQRYSSLESSFFTLRDRCSTSDRECSFLRTELQRYTDSGSGTAASSNPSATLSREFPLRELVESLQRNVRQAAGQLKTLPPSMDSKSNVDTSSVPSDVDHQLQVVDHFRQQRDSAVENEKLTLLKLAEAELAYQRLLGECAKLQGDNSRLSREVAELRRHYNAVTTVSAEQPPNTLSPLAFRAAAGLLQEVDGSNHPLGHYLNVEDRQPVEQAEQLGETASSTTKVNDFGVDAMVCNVGKAPSQALKTVSLAPLGLGDTFHSSAALATTNGSLDDNVPSSADQERLKVDVNCGPRLGDWSNYSDVQPAKSGAVAASDAPNRLNESRDMLTASQEALESAGMSNEIPNDCDESAGKIDPVLDAARVNDGGMAPERPTDLIDRSGALEYLPTRLRLPRHTLGKATDSWWSETPPITCSRLPEQLHDACTQPGTHAEPPNRFADILETTTTRATTPTALPSGSPTLDIVSSCDFPLTTTTAALSLEESKVQTLLPSVRRGHSNDHGSSTPSAPFSSRNLPAKTDESREPPNVASPSSVAAASSRQVARGMGNSKRNGTSTLSRKNGFGSKSSKAAGFFD